MENRKKNLYVLSLGHFAADINQGALSAVLPFLIAARNYDYATAALLVSISNIFGSIVQPMFGFLADQKNRPWLMILGTSLAAAGMALTGICRTFAGLCAAVIISGIGVALFHPPGAQLVSRTSSPEEAGKGISIFSFGGKAGSTLAPLLITAGIGLFGMPGTMVMLVPALVFGIFCTACLKNFAALEKQENSTADAAKAEGKDDWHAFIRLSVICFGRSVITASVSTFLALYFINVLNTSTAFGNTLLSAVNLVGALVTFAGGTLSDRFGYVRMLRISFWMLIPSLICFALTRNVIIACLLLLPIGAGESLSYSPMVVLGQKYLPNHVGFASGITLGLAVSVGSILAPVLGHIGDTYGLPMIFIIIGVVAAAALIVSMFLADTSRYQRAKAV